MIELKKFTEKHLEKTFYWMQNEELKNAFLFEKVVTRHSHQIWFSNINKDATQQIYAIFYEGTHVGNIGLKNIDLRNKNAESWIYIGNTDYRGKRIAIKSLDILNSKVRKDMVKLYAKIADFNFISLKTFLSAGYHIEGYLYKEMKFKGNFINLFRLYQVL